ERVPERYGELRAGVVVQVERAGEPRELVGAAVGVVECRELAADGARRRLRRMEPLPFERLLDVCLAERGHRERARVEAVVGDRAAHLSAEPSREPRELAAEALPGEEQ